MKKEITYETPEVTVYKIHSEGCLCQSYGDDGMPGRNGSFGEEEEDY